MQVRYAGIVCRNPCRFAEKDLSKNLLACHAMPRPPNAHIVPCTEKSVRVDQQLILASRY